MRAVLLLLVAAAACTSTSPEGAVVGPPEQLSKATPLNGAASWSPQESSIVAFGASWCEPCWLEWDGLAKASLPSGSRVFVVLTEDAGPERQRVEQWAAAKAPSFVLVPDTQGLLGDAWGIKTLPALVVWDGDRKQAAFQSQGFRPGVVETAVATLTSLASPAG